MIRGTKLTSLPDGPPVATRRAGRICAGDGCGTRLSIYNPQPFCGVHAQDHESVVPDGCCRCPMCHRVLEWTPEYFHRDRAARRGRDHATPPQGLHRICKDCRNGYNRESAQKPLEIREFKYCSCCGRSKRLTRQWWYFSSSNEHAGGWSSRCKQCDQERNRDRAARDREERTP